MATDLAIRPATESLPATRPRLGKLLQAAALRTRNSLALVTTTLIGLVVLANGQPWIGFATMSAGLTAFGILVLHDLFDPGLIREVHGIDDPEDRKLGAGPASLDRPLDWSRAAGSDGVEVAADHRELFASIISAHEAIRLHLVSASPMVRDALLDSYLRCSEMALLAVPLVKRGRFLTDYLTRQPLDALEEEALALETLTAQSDDPGAVRSFGAAAKAQRAHLTACHEIEGLRDQVAAQLAVIRATLYLVEARLVKLAACDADIEQNVSHAVDELSDLLSLELGSLEAAVSESLVG